MNRTDPGRLLLSQCDTYPFLERVIDECEACAQAIVSSYRNGGKVLVCGNGGSCSDADHIVGELMKGFLLKRRIEELPGVDNELVKHLQGAVCAINLGAQTSLISAIVNDIGGEYIFAQQVVGYGNPGDVFIGISTSGNSRNVLYAGQVAKAKGLITVALTGSSGGHMADCFDIVIKAPSDVVDGIQNYHTPIYHTICKIVENELWGDTE